MHLFETAWKEDYSFYERVYDTQLKKSIKRQIKLPYEWYEESSNGDYSYILDDKIKLTRHQGKAKDGRNHYGFIDPLYRNIKDNYWGKEQYNQTPRTWYLDIETRVGQNPQSEGFPVPEKALEEVVLIQVYDSELNVMIVIGSRPWYYEQDYALDFKHQYIETSNEIELFQTYFKIFAKLNPLIIYAWNGLGFDFPYLYNRVQSLGMDVNLFSNYGAVSLKESQFQGNTLFSIKSDGHYYIDMLDIYKKFVFKPQPNYTLDTTAEIVLGKKKVSHDEYAAFDDFYSGKYITPLNPDLRQKNSRVYKAAVAGNKQEMQEASYSDFVYYGCVDAHLVYEIDKAKNFTALLLMISQKMGVLIDDALGTVKPWAQYITNRALANKQVMPKKISNDDDISIKGGYVATPRVGKHSWIISADINSMYPLIGMVGFNSSPETFIPKYKLPTDLREYVLRYYNSEDEDSIFEIPADVKHEVSKMLKRYNYSLSINGAVYDNSKIGMVPEMVQDIYKTRKEAKKTMFDFEKRKLLIKDIINAKESVQ